MVGLLFVGAYGHNWDSDQRDHEVPHGLAIRNDQLEQIKWRREAKRAVNNSDR